jgi:hypothetical protein
VGTGAATIPAGPPVPIVAPAPALARSDPPPPPDEGWAQPPAEEEAATVTRLDAKSIAAELRNEMRAEMHDAIGAAVTPLQQKILELAAQLDAARKERADLAGKVAALAAAPPSAQVVSAQLVSAMPLPAPPRVAAIDPVVINERTAQTMPPSGRAPTLNFDTAPYPDMPGMLDGSRRKRLVAWFVTFVLVALVGGIGLMTILSYSH